MESNIEKKSSRYIVIGSLGIIVLLILIQIGLYLGAKKNPNLFGDKQGIAQTLSKRIIDAQSSYKDTHGQYAQNSKELSVEKSDKFYFGYANEVPKEIRSLCEACTVHNDGYSMLLVLKDDGSVWKFNNREDVIQIK